MAIVYTTGTINQPDAGSVGLSMAEKIRDDVVAHAAWDLVEEYYPAAGEVRWYVFKCLAAVSGLPADFFVVMGRTLANGELRMFVCENYNAAGHQAQHWAPDGFTASYLFDSQGRHTPQFTLGSVPIPSGNNPDYRSWVPSGTSTKWWITVDNDGFTVAFNGASNGFFHVGAYTPLTQSVINMPLQLTSSSDSVSCLTRNPALADQNVPAIGLMFEGGGSNPAGQYGPTLGFRGDLRYNDKLQSNQRPVAEQGMNIYVYNSGDQALNGWALGKQKRMRVGGQYTPVGFAFGDAYALGGSLWVPYKPDDSRIWNTGVASA